MSSTYNTVSTFLRYLSFINLIHFNLCNFKKHLTSQTDVVYILCIDTLALYYKSNIGLSFIEIIAILYCPGL